MLHKNTQNKLFLVSLVVLSAALLLCSISRIGRKEQFWIEAESALKIVPPLRIIADENASQGKALESIGMSHKVEGFALYDLEIPTSGNYQFWARCYWPGSCSNSFLIRAENSSKYYLGNDEILNVWHWVRGPSFFLESGARQIFILNEEFDAKIDEFLLTQDPRFIPRGIDQTSDYLIDFENRRATFLVPKTAGKWSIRIDRSLSGIAAPLTVADIKQPIELVLTIKNSASQLYRLIDNDFLTDYLNYVDIRNTFPVSDVFLAQVVKSLNRSIFSRNFVTDFGYKMNDFLQEFISQNSLQDSIHCINRLLLEDRFSQIIGNKFACYLNKTDRDFEYSLLDLECPDTFVFQSKIKLGELPGSQKQAKLIFNFKNPENYYCLQIQKDSLIVKRIYRRKMQVLSAQAAAEGVGLTNYTHFSIIRNGASINVKQDGKLIFALEDSLFSGGRVGVGSDFGDIWFDDMSLVTKPEPILENNFFEPDWNNQKNWQIVSGDWKHNRGLVGELLGRRKSDKEALIVVGEDYWKDYSIILAAKADNDAGLGVCFNFNNSDNFYLFQWIKQGTAWLKQLVKHENGIETVLARENGGFQNDVWYKIQIIRNSCQTSVFIDDEKVFTDNDCTFNWGKIGLWTCSSEDVHFSAIKVTSVKSLDSEPKHRFTYKFEMREQAALDHCDWRPVSNRNGLSFIDRNDVEVSKSLFETTMFENKRLFQGNFSLSISLRDALPRGVDARFFLTGYTNGIPVNYEVKIADSLARVYSENHIQQARILGSRKNYRISLQGNIFKLGVENQELINCFQRNEFDSLRVATGFSGVGEAFVKFQNIDFQADGFIQKSPVQN